MPPLDVTDVRRFGQPDEGVLRVRSRYPAARVDDWQARPGDDADRLPQLVRARHDRRDRRRIPELHVLLLHANLGRHLDQHGAGAAAAHLPEGFGDGCGNLTRPHHRPLPFRHGAHCVGLVQHLVYRADILADGTPWHLTDDDEHGRGASVCRGQAGGGVVEPDARHHQRNTRLPRSAGIAIGHIRRGLLVSERDQANPRLVTQARDDPVRLDARDPEDDLDALGDERPGKGFTTAEFDHGSFRPSARRGYGAVLKSATTTPRPP